MKFPLVSAVVPCILFALTLVAPVQAETVKVADFDGAMGQISDGVGDIASKVNTKDLKIKKDLVTLAIGGAVGLLAGSVAASLVDMELMGVSIVPVAGALAGVYLANEGYLDALTGKK